MWCFFQRYHSVVYGLADDPNDVFFWSRRRAVFFEGGKLHGRVFLIEKLAWACFFTRLNYLTLCMPYPLFPSRFTKKMRNRKDHY